MVKIKGKELKLESLKEFFYKGIKTIVNFLIKIRLAIAIVLDIVDFFVAWFPFINSLWDVVSFLFLLITLRNKTLASLSLLELAFVGFPPFNVYDAFIPSATILTIIDFLQTEVYVVKV